jgi:ubiquinone/menaquinone biosynthesis C-methylase UbiE
MFRRFPPGHADYAAGPFNRLVDAFNTYHGRLLIVGSGDLPSSHVKIAEEFGQVQCLDLSIVALALARQALGDRVELTHGSIVDTEIENNSIDAVLCAHVLYHIDSAHQERAVRQMLRIR